MLKDDEGSSITCKGGNLTGDPQDSHEENVLIMSGFTTREIVLYKNSIMFKETPEKLRCHCS